MLDLTKLKAFIYSAETLSFSEASKILNLTQPTISHHINNLERELRAKLFVRSRSKLTLTESGRILLPWARKLVRQATEIQDLMASVQNEAIGNLRIACSVASGKYVLPHLAARFRYRFPSVQVSILSCAPEQVIPRLLEEEANLALVSFEMIDPSMESQILFTDSVSLIVPAGHLWQERGHITAADLIGEPIIMREPTSGSLRVLTAELAKSDITLDDLDIFLELGNAEGIVQAVAAGYGVAFVSELVADCALRREQVTIVQVEDWKLRRNIYMVRQALKPHNRVTEAFWSFVHEPGNSDILVVE